MTAQRIEEIKNELRAFGDELVKNKHYGTPAMQTANFNERAAVVEAIAALTSLTRRMDDYSGAFAKGLEALND